MNAAELDALVRQFLVDHKLSDTERQVLKDWVAKNIGNEHQRAVARSRIFEAARSSVGDPQAAMVIEFLEDALRVVVPMTPPDQSTAPDEVFFSPGDACLQRIISRLNGTRLSADICVFTITDDRISAAILELHRRGAKVRIITDNEKAFDEGSDVVRFQQAGIPLKVDITPFHMHHKFAIFDGRRVLNGSYNWTRSAANSNCENVVDTGDPAAVARFQHEFEQLWTKLS